MEQSRNSVTARGRVSRCRNYSRSHSEPPVASANEAKLIPRSRLLPCPKPLPRLIRPLVSAFEKLFHGSCKFAGLSILRTSRNDDCQAVKQVSPRNAERSNSAPQGPASRLRAVRSSFEWSAVRAPGTAFDRVDSRIPDSAETEIWRPFLVSL